MIEPLQSKASANSGGVNTAFRDLTHRFLFRPLTEAVGPRLAIVSGFTFSGLVHDLVISVLAGGGYGWPTLYFIVQALATTWPRRRDSVAVSAWDEASAGGCGPSRRLPCQRSDYSIRRSSAASSCRS